MKRIIKYRWPIIIISFAVAAILSVNLKDLKVDSDLKNYFPKDMESMLATNLIEENFGSQDILMIIFEKENILNPVSLTRIKEVNKKIMRIGGVRKTTSLFSSNRIYGKDGVMYVEPAIIRIPEDSSQLIQLQESLISNNLVMNIVLADDFNSSSIIALLEKDVDEKKILNEIESILSTIPGNEKIHFGGLPYLRQIMNKDIARDGKILIPAALLLMIVFLFVVFREWRGVLLPFLVVIMSCTMALAIIPLIGWKFYFITLLVPVMLIAIANDYGIHIIAMYQEINAENNDLSMKEISLVIAKKLWKPILITGLTTIAGTAALLAHTMIPARQMAIVAGIGIMLALLYSIIFLPALLSFTKRSKPLKSLKSHKSQKRNLLNRLSFFIIKNHIKIPRATLLITIVLGLGIIFLKVDSNEENFFPEKHPVKQASKIINSQYGGSENLSLMFSGDMMDPELLSRIEKYENILLKESEIDLIMSFPDVIKEISKALYEPGNELYDKIPEDKNAIAQYIELYNLNGDPGNLDQLVDFNYTKSHMLIRINNVGNQEVTRIIKLIKQITNNDENVAAIGGYGFVRSQLANQVVRGQFYSLFIALVIIFIILALIFRSLVAGLISIIPLGISMLLLFGIMGYLGIKLDVATALLSSIMIGVGVDYTIHFLWRYREERRQFRAPKEAVITTLTTTGRGILFNALSVIVGFVILIISSFTPIRFFGVLIVISIFSCLIGALVVLPALILNFRFKFLEPDSRKIDTQEDHPLLTAI